VDSPVVPREWHVVTRHCLWLTFQRWNRKVMENPWKIHGCFTSFQYVWASEVQRIKCQNTNKQCEDNAKVEFPRRTQDHT
jgi:hypothetical protein